MFQIWEKNWSCYSSYLEWLLICKMDLFQLISLHFITFHLIILSVKVRLHRWRYIITILFVTRTSRVDGHRYELPEISDNSCPFIIWQTSPHHLHHFRFCLRWKIQEKVTPHHDSRTRQICRLTDVYDMCDAIFLKGVYIAHRLWAKQAKSTV